ncbi:MAG: GH3 auxin-responsive promoter family protein [Candidatus Bathyarchaeota archaeon]|nr:GH3 auxin-responsive promoter family protein [Candidatus Bathyarchaeota archaeon]
MLSDETTISSILNPIISPWYESIKTPKKAQEQVFNKLLIDYAKTDFGKSCGASEIKDLESYQKNFPILDYKSLLPYLVKVREGDYQTILSEDPDYWVMTRGSTGNSKVLPATKTHLKQIFSCGARAIINYALRKKNFEVFTGDILNLNFPSAVHDMTVNGKKVTFGYSSGTYARLNPMFDRVSLVPRQEQIDALGSGIAKKQWEKRFELVYQTALEKKITATMGVVPVILSFARYVKRKYGKKPSDLWNFKALFCTSVPKIQFKYAPVLRKYFGSAPVIEMYTATEGVFAQQLDDLPYVTPNYDSYFFEVKTGKGIKMLHDLKRGEWGSLLISSCMFPRYNIGDLIESAGKQYFRVFGRRKVLTLLEHRLYRLFLGRLL